jgi:hypothetical protein
VRDRIEPKRAAGSGDGGLGALASVAAFVIGFVPPSQFGSGSTLRYVLIVGGGMCVVGLLIPYLFYRRPSRTRSSAMVGRYAAGYEVRQHNQVRRWHDFRRT